MFAPKAVEACCGGCSLVADNIDPNGCVSKIIGKLPGGFVAGLAIARHGPVTPGRAGCALATAFAGAFAVAGRVRRRRIEISLHDNVLKNGKSIE